MLDSESHTYCMTICQTLVVFVIAGSGDMIMFYSTIQPHINCPFFYYLSFNIQAFSLQIAFIYVTLAVAPPPKGG